MTLPAPTPRALHYGSLLFALLLLLTAPAGAQEGRELDCATLPCGLVLPGASEFRPVEAQPAYVEGRDASGEVVGWVALSTDWVDVAAYSGKPMVTLVGLDPAGIITGARVVHHSEPILLVGIPESALHEFADFYAGKRAVERIVVGRASRPDMVAVDAISGATVTALAQNRTILETAVKLGAEVGVVSVSAVLPGRFVQEPEPWSFPRMLEEGALGRLRVTHEEMGLPGGERAFVDLFFGIADAPQVGRALMGDRDYAYYLGRLEEGEHLVVVLGNGTESFKGSGFVRGGLFDRVRIQQGLREITFRDTDYYNLPGTSAEGAPSFKEGAIFVARGGRLDPGSPYELVFLGSRYDRRGAFTREFHEFSASHQLPASIYAVERDEPLWVQAWRNRAMDAALLGAYLLFVIGVFSARRYTTADPKRIKQMHLASMVLGFGLVGVFMGAQPSVTQMLTFVEAVVGDWRWGLFLSEPLLFILWIFIAGVSVTWGRGVFCGWVCPYGALTELVFKVGEKLGIKAYELPDAIHFKLRYLRYAVLGLLIPVFLWDSVLGEKLAEVEPFKSTFLVPAWTRPPGFLAWWLVLLAISLFSYRPFCRYLCPMGGGLALLGSFRFSGPRRRKFCSSCQICTRGCEPRAIRPDGSIDPRECLSCMDCEATYRNQAACPPLLGISRIEALEVVGPTEQRKLAELRGQAEDV